MRKQNAHVKGHGRENSFRNAKFLSGVSRNRKAKRSRSMARVLRRSHRRQKRCFLRSGRKIQVQTPDSPPVAYIIGVPLLAPDL